MFYKLFVPNSYPECKGLVSMSYTLLTQLSNIEGKSINYLFLPRTDHKIDDIQCRDKIVQV